MRDDAMRTWKSYDKEIAQLNDVQDAISSNEADARKRLSMNSVNRIRNSFRPKTMSASFRQN